MLSSLLTELQNIVTPTQQPPKKKAHPKPIKTTYESVPIELPPGFLATEPGVTPVPSLTEIDWEKTELPENKGLYAVVLDGVLSREECDSLKKLAEGSVPHSKWVDIDPDAAAAEEESSSKGGGVEGETPNEQQQSKETETEEKKKKTPWGPALVNVGMGYEVLTPSYRNSSRIIWDQQEVVDRLWARCCLVPGLKERLAVLDSKTERDAKIITGRSLADGNGEQLKEVERYANGKKKGKSKQRKDNAKGREKGRTGKWEFVKVNKRMRFLKYGEGQFFRAHCDSPYRELDPTNSDRINETLFTIHLYLNDCKSEAPPDRKDETELVGGATALLSADEKRKYDVECKTGRVLIFQHRRVFHAGADVVRGVKYSVRTDIMYREVLEEEKEDEVEGKEEGKKEDEVKGNEKAEKKADSDDKPLKEAGGGN
ncbi:hypothetical protein N0V85_000556 [Neurospora sp. IMI 360204]|nr:hypothetical protein N0V85_000556 [Neurospora sp. IMI 360204]